MGRMFIFVVAVAAGGFAFNQYTGKNPIRSFQSFSGLGGGGGFAGGYGVAVDSGRTIGGSVKGMANGVSSSFGQMGN